MAYLSKKAAKRIASLFNGVECGGIMQDAKLKEKNYERALYWQRQADEAVVKLYTEFGIELATYNNALWRIEQGPTV